MLRARITARVTDQVDDALLHHRLHDPEFIVHITMNSRRACRCGSPAIRVTSSASPGDPFVNAQTAAVIAAVAVDPFDPEHDRNLRWFAGTLQPHGDGEVARAVAGLAGRGHVAGVRRVPGDGIAGPVDRHPVRMGRPEWIGFQSTPGRDYGHTVAVEVDGRPLGHITVAEEIRNEASQAIAALRASGVVVVVVTGLSDGDAGHLARHAALEDLHAGVVNADRRDLLERHRAAGRIVAAVGRADDLARWAETPP